MSNHAKSNGAHRRFQHGAIVAVPCLIALAPPGHEAGRLNEFSGQSGPSPGRAPGSVGAGDGPGPCAGGVRFFQQGRAAPFVHQAVH